MQNKIRSFNILGGIHGPRTHSMAAFAPRAQRLPPQPSGAGSEVFVISRRRSGGQPLEKQQIEFWRRAEESGQQRMDLAAVVGLVIDPVRQRRPQLLLDFLRRRDAPLFDGAGYS